MARVIPTYVYGGSYKRGMTKCVRCDEPIVFDEKTIVWLAARGSIVDKVTCDRSPTNLHLAPV